MLTPADLARHLAAHHIAADLITGIGDTPTVVAAAAALGVLPDQVIKTLLFFVADRPHTIIAHGLAPVRDRSLATHFGVGKRQIRLARAEEVLAITGYPAGGVPPFGHLQPTPVLAARSLLAYETIFGGGGDERTMMRLSTAELLRVARPALIDLHST
jgi:prolyl-tRNA editing enzyme YbaK/EbsC (Cys-tRNA(Pro) deacylase)